MQQLIELALKRIETLEKKLEKYYTMLKFENEIDFILKGTYVTAEEIENIVQGN